VPSPLAFLALSASVNLPALLTESHRAPAARLYARAVGRAMGQDSSSHQRAVHGWEGQADRVAQLWSGFQSRRGHRLLLSLMQVGCNIEVEMAHRVLRFTLVASSYPLKAQAPLHEVTQHRGARPAQAFGQVVHFLPCRRVKAGIRADAWPCAAGPMIWRSVRRYSSVSGILDAGGGPPDEW
jgi:hypothetical protein